MSSIRCLHRSRSTTTTYFRLSLAHLPVHWHSEFGPSLRRPPPLRALTRRYESNDPNDSAGVDGDLAATASILLVRLMRQEEARDLGPLHVTIPFSAA
jgi:hypothetical protein